MNKAIEIGTRIILMTALVGAVACGDDDEVDSGEGEEVITTVDLVLDGGGATIMGQWLDSDGNGTVDEITQPDALTAGTTYSVSIVITNELEGEDVTEEIREEAEEHQIFYETTGTVGDITITDFESTYNADTMGDDLPVGLTASLAASGTAGTGTLRISLRHLPPEGGMIRKTPTTTIDDGESDFDINFNITVQ